eukprot:gene7129-biopygen6020
MAFGTMRGQCASAPRALVLRVVAGPLGHHNGTFGLKGHADYRRAAATAVAMAVAMVEVGRWSSALWRPCSMTPCPCSACTLQPSACSPHLPQLGSPPWQLFLGLLLMNIFGTIFEVQMAVLSQIGLSWCSSFPSLKFNPEKKLPLVPLLVLRKHYPRICCFKFAAIPALAAGRKEWRER